MVLRFHNTQTGACYPSLQAIAEAAKCGERVDRVVKSAGRVLALFEFFAARRAPAAVGEIAAALA